MSGAKKISALQREILSGFIDGLTPEERIKVSEWADKYRILSPVSSSEPGKWSTNRTPFLRDIMDNLSSVELYEMIIFVKGSQVGGTEVGLNWLSYIMDISPGPVLLVMPTDQTMLRNSKTRIAPMIETSPRLRAKVASARSRDSGNTLMSKEFPGGQLVMGGANSPAGLRSMPIKYLFLDEVDAYPKDLKGEGAPAELAKVRTRTFARKKIYYVSSPTIEGDSIIQSEFEDTDQRYYFVPCPDCGDMQILEFSHLVWETGKYGDVRYACRACGVLIEERHKPRMLGAGQWRATCPEKTSTTKIGYHLSSLYSPLGWYSWGKMAEDYEAALKEPLKMKTFINTVLGETYKEPGESPPWENIYNRREAYKMNVVPIHVCFLTCGVDVQKDRLELEIVGWCRGKRSYSIDYRVYFGDTSKPEVWDKLAAVISEQWPREDGAHVSLRMMCVDSGYNTAHVYAFCQRFDATRVVAVKGKDDQEVMVTAPKSVQVTMAGKQTGRARKWSVGVSVIKSELYGMLRIEPVDKDGKAVQPDGYCHFPQYAPEYFKGLTAEQLQFTIVRGFRKYIWVKKFERNEPLDCRVYARAAAEIVGISRMSEPDWIEMFDTAYSLDEEETKPAKQTRNEDDFWARR